MFFKNRSAGINWLVVFLGNPGPKYANSRHNVGFLVADQIQEQKRARIQRLKFHALTATCTLGGEKTLLMKPQTYMNLSGRAVAPAAAFYKVESRHILAVSDDTSLPPGKIRIRTKGSDGGHNGLKSIISSLGSDEFPRIKIGVGAPDHPGFDLADWVLGSFSPKDRELIDGAVKRAAKAIEVYIRNGPDEAMSLFN